jgi:hemerythrin
MAETLIEWRDEFSVGVPDVDLEHQEMIALINRLYVEMMSRSGSPDVPAFLGEIHARIQAHFALEERIMREHRYDRYAAHKADHEQLLDDIRDIMDDVEDGVLFDRTQLSDLLAVWFVEHFRQHDGRLHGRLG